LLLLLLLLINTARGRRRDESLQTRGQNLQYKGVTMVRIPGARRGWGWGRSSAVLQLFLFTIFHTETFAWPGLELLQNTSHESNEIDVLYGSL
jgi:hypothetical protein